MLAFVGLFLLTVVLPVVINLSSESGHFNRLKPYLREIWTFLVAFAGIYYLATPSVKEVMMAIHERVPVAGWIGYTVCAVAGASILCGFWWFTGKVIAPPPESSAARVTRIINASKASQPPAAPASSSMSARVARVLAASPAPARPDGSTVEGTKTQDTPSVTRSPQQNLSKSDQQDRDLEDERKALPPLPKTSTAADERPTVGLRFVYPKSPALVITNASGAVVRDIKWSVALWNLDLPDRNDPLPIPVSTFDWIRAHDEGGPQDLFALPSVAPLLKSGNRLLGSAAVDCPECVRGTTYIVSIVWGSGGWFAETPAGKGKLVIPPNFLRPTRDEYFKSLEGAVPESSRIPIAER